MQKGHPDAAQALSASLLDTVENQLHHAINPRPTWIAGSLETIIRKRAAESLALIAQHLRDGVTAPDVPLRLRRIATNLFTYSKKVDSIDDGLQNTGLQLKIGTFVGVKGGVRRFD